MKAPTNTADNLVVQLRTILEPLDLAELFPQSQPLEVELGCGDASFLAEYARQNPAKNFIGVERLLGRIQKLDRKGRRLGLVTCLTSRCGARAIALPSLRTMNTPPIANIC